MHFTGLRPTTRSIFSSETPTWPAAIFWENASVTNSLLYKSDIRGDELKKKGDLFQYQEF